MRIWKPISLVRECFLRSIIYKRSFEREDNSTIPRRNYENLRAWSGSRDIMVGRKGLQNSKNFSTNLTLLSFPFQKKRRRRRNHPRSEVSSAIGKWFNLKTRKVDSMTIPPPPTLCSRIEVDVESCCPKHIFARLANSLAFGGRPILWSSLSQEDLLSLRSFQDFHPFLSKRILSGRKSREKNRIDTSWTLEEIEKNRQTGKKIIATRKRVRQYKTRNIHK